MGSWERISSAEEVTEETQRDCRHNFNGRFKYRFSCLIHNGGFKSCVRSSINKLFMIFFLTIFNYYFSFHVTLEFLLETHLKRKTTISLTFLSRKQLRCQHLLSLRESMQNACRIYSGLGPQPLYNLFAVNEYGFTPFANGGCQSLLQSTRMGSHPLLMVDVKVY